MGKKKDSKKTEKSQGNHESLAIWKRITEPVTIAWDGECPVIHFKLPPEITDGACLARLELESGKTSELKWRVSDLPIMKSVEVEGKCHLVRKYTLPEGLPYGYHQFVFGIKGKLWNTLIMSGSSSSHAISSRHQSSLAPLTT